MSGNTFVLNKLATILVGRHHLSLADVFALPAMVELCARKVGWSQWDFIMNARQNVALQEELARLCKLAAQGDREVTP
jgi:hypothetical protein